MDNKKDDKYYGEKCENNIIAIKKYLGNKTYKEFVSDEKLVDAIMFRLIQLVENIKNLSTDFKNKNPQIPWGDIVGFRNGIVHEYGKTDYSVVYETITVDFVELENALKKLF